MNPYSSFKKSARALQMLSVLLLPVLVIPAAPLLGISALAIALLLIKSIPMYAPHIDCALYSKQQ